MGVTTTKTNKPLNPRGNDQSPLAFNRAKLYSGKALDFDGVNDSVSVPDSANLSFGNGTTDSPFSITGYFNLDTLGANQTIAAKDGAGGSNREYSLFVNSSNKLRFFLKSNGGGNQQSIDSDLVLETGKWYFVSATYDGRGGDTAYQGLNIYVNTQLTGVSLITNDSYTAMTNTTAPFTAGVYSVNWMNGQLSNIKVFAGELTAAQVADLYNNPEKVVPTGVDNTALKLWLPMQEGAGTTAYDGSGNGNHGTISGATYVHGIGAPVAQTAVIDWNKGTNIIARSENAEHANWDKFFLTATDGETDPLGTSRAFEITEDAVLNSRNIRSSYFSAVSGTQYYFSVIAKQGSGSRYLGFAGAGIAGASEAPVFDLQNGSVDTGASSVLVKSASIEAYGSDGWYKCSMVYEANATTTYQIWLTMCQNATDNGTSNYSYVGNGTSSIFLFAPILKVGSAEGVYVQTIATTQPNDVLLPQGLTSGRDITGVNLFENVRKQGALNLDGNSWAEVHDNASLDITDAITLEAWVYWDGSNGKGLLGRWSTGADSNYLLYTTSSSIGQFYINTTAVSNINTSTLTAGNWYHIVGTYDGSDMRIYLNGSESSNTSKTGSISTSADPIEIGRYYQSSSFAYADQIAQPRIYNRALTAEEVQRNYNAGKNTYTN